MLLNNHASRWLSRQLSGPKRTSTNYRPIRPRPSRTTCRSVVLDLIFSGCVAGQNIERRLDVRPEVRQLREVHHDKARLLERHKVLVSDNVSRRLVHRLSSLLRFYTLHIAPIALRFTKSIIASYNNLSVPYSLPALPCPGLPQPPMCTGRHPPCYMNFDGRLLSRLVGSTGPE